MGMSRPMASSPGRTSSSTKCVSCRMRMVWGKPIRRGLDTFDDLLAQAVVLVGAARLRGEAENRLAVSRALLEADALRDRRGEDAPPEHVRDGLLHVASEGRALVVQCDHCAQELQLAVWPRADPIDGLQEVVRPLEGEVARLDGNEQMRRR